MLSADYSGAKLKRGMVISVMETIAFLELNSIAKGIEAADTILKAAEVELIFARVGCPGKYNILFAGDVAAVKASLDAGETVGGANVVDSCIIPRVHPQVIKAINLSATPTEVNAVGIMEFFSVTASIYAADAAVKAADVTLMDVRLGTGIGGKSFVVLTGEVAAVNEAVSCGIHSHNSSGMVVASVVIPNPRPEIFESLM